MDRISFHMESWGVKFNPLQNHRITRGKEREEEARTSDLAGVSVPLPPLLQVYIMKLQFHEEGEENFDRRGTLSFLYTLNLKRFQLCRGLYFQANPKLISYKKKVLPRLSEWIDVIGDSTANGNIQRTAGTVDVDDDMEDLEAHNSDPLLDSTMAFESIDLDEDGGTQHVSNSPPLSEGPKTTKLNPRKRKSLASSLKEEMGNMFGTMVSFVDVMKEKNHYDDILLDKVCDAVTAIKDLDEDLKVEALELFSGEHAENKKRCFIRIPEHKRMGWILKKLDYGNQ